MNGPVSGASALPDVVVKGPKMIRLLAKNRQHRLRSNFVAGCRRRDLHLTPASACARPARPWLQGTTKWLKSAIYSPCECTADRSIVAAHMQSPLCARTWLPARYADGKQIWLWFGRPRPPRSPVRPPPPPLS